MVYKCLYCGSTSKNNDDAVSFHRFPKDQRRYLWLDSLGLSNAGMWDKICSRHFNPQHFIVGG
ncbi:THAP-type domain-containing protein, partial [Aphis craccivora]